MFRAKGEHLKISSQLQWFMMGSVTVTLSLRVCLRGRSDSCSWFRMLLLTCSPRPEESIGSRYTFAGHHRDDFKILLLVCTGLNRSGPKYFSDVLIHYELHSPVSGFVAQVYYQFPKSEWNMKRQLSLLLHQIPGTNSQKPSGLLQPSVFLNQRWTVFVHHCL